MFISRVKYASDEIDQDLEFPNKFPNFNLTTSPDELKEYLGKAKYLMLRGNCIYMVNFDTWQRCKTIQSKTFLD